MSNLSPVDWSPIDALVMDGRQVVYKSPNGEFEGPALPPTQPTREDRMELYKAAGFPDAGWNPTHWREL